MARPLRQILAHAGEGRGRPLEWALAAALVGLGCAGPPSLGDIPQPTAHQAAAQRGARTSAQRGSGPLVLVHGGQGSPASRSDGPAQAAEAGFVVLSKAGAGAGAPGEPSRGVSAALAAIEFLEDDPRYNAGFGANLRLDGRTIQADAAIMDEEGRFGAVAGVDGVRHPVLLAAAVRHTPHVLVAGEGAQALAEVLELEPAVLASEQARLKLERGYARLFAGEVGGAWVDWDWRAHWNFEGAPPADLAAAQAMVQEARADDTQAPQPAVDEGEPDETQDTVGVVLRTADGRYVAALSTGGTTLAIRGRVGDVPILGAGLYAGPQGAVAATGKGEAIIRERVAVEVYRHLARGLRPEDAIGLAIRGIRAGEGVGVIAVSDRGWAARATSQMAWAARDGEGLERADTHVQRVGR